jgi:hypothetical protein
MPAKTSYESRFSGPAKLVKPDDQGTRRSPGYPPDLGITLPTVALIRSIRNRHVLTVALHLGPSVRGRQE